jgi:hypothetical protein
MPRAFIPECWADAIHERIERDRVALDTHFALCPPRTPPTPGQIIAGQIREQREALALSIAPWLAPREDY